MMDFIPFFASNGIDSERVSHLAGGDINEVFRVENTVYKVNRIDKFPDMFRREAEGLELLSEHIGTPQRLEVGIQEQFQYLKMEYVEAGQKNGLFWKNFGVQLANLHAQERTRFGLDNSNFIGSLVQTNNAKNNWKEFLVEERLQPMLEMAINSGEVNYAEGKVFEKFYNRINEVYSEEPASLLHGDLWNGNYLCNKNSQVILIDPAVYYGHREMDIGMMHLFGGFHETLFNTYNEIRPLDPGWKDRIKVCQLYPLLVHVNLFGRKYWNQIVPILTPFS